MARYVVVEFARNADAEAFIAETNEATQSGVLRRIVGVFVKPGKYCECPMRNRSNYRADDAKHGWSGGVERGEKFGWWVCTICNRPRVSGHNLVNQVRPSELFAELLSTKDTVYEMTVVGLNVAGVPVKNIDRPKKLKKVMKLWRAGSSS